MSITDRVAECISNDCDLTAEWRSFGSMRKLRAYLILTLIVAFVAYFGVYGFYDVLADRIGHGWSLFGAALIALGTVVIAATGITIIRSQEVEWKNDSDQ